MKFIPVSPLEIAEYAEVSCKCWDSDGGFKTYRRSVFLDNKKIRIDKDSVEFALAEQSTDVNSILLLADMFVTKHYGKPYYYDQD